MLLSMSSPSSRGLLFTIAAVASFMLGCGGLFQEGADPQVPSAASDEYEQAEVESAQQSEVIGDSSGASDSAAYDDTDPSALTEFRTELDPNGAWVEDPVYGTVWIPSRAAVGSDFAPYVSAGHWGYTEQGDWIWESDYSWGWVTFHYGRWVWIPERGWSWIPGRRYAPAWVVWRVGDPGYDYVGWAPMPPYFYWTGGVAVGLWMVPPAPYVFCPSSHVFYPNVHQHIVTGPQVSGVASHSTVHSPARPGMGGVGRAYDPARPSRGPSLSTAHVPATASPHGFASPPSKAVVAATPSGRLPTAAGRVASPASRGPVLSQSPVSRSPAATASTMSRPVYRGVPSQVQPRPGQSSTRTSGLPSSPYYGPTVPSRSAGTPTFHTPSSGYSPSMSTGGFHPSTSSGGFHPSSSGGFHPSSSSGGFHPSSSSGGFHPSSSSGGFHPSTSSGGFHPSSKPSSGGGGRSGGGRGGHR